MLYPLKFEPIFRQMVWGGDRIPSYKGVKSDIPHIGESWEISAYGDKISVVAEGPLKGRDLNSLVREFKGGLVGEHVYAATGDKFPLLIKFIDAANDLSIQVHPNDDVARANHGKEAMGKTEMWYVIAADPGACLYSGLAKEMSPDDYERRVKDGSITEVLARYEVKPGDVFFLPAGRIHAICKGCFVAEIQQTSDLTYRIWDYGRLGLDGKPRQLHTALAKGAIDYKVYPEGYKTAYTPAKDCEVKIVDCPFFTTSIYDIDKAVTRQLGDIDSFVVLMCLEGSGTVTALGKNVPLRHGETLLIPAQAASFELQPETGMKVLTSYVR